MFSSQNLPELPDNLVLIIGFAVEYSDFTCFAVVENANELFSCDKRHVTPTYKCAPLHVLFTTPVAHYAI